MKRTLTANERAEFGKKFLGQLQGKGLLAKAFQNLCAGGCEPAKLARLLSTLTRLSPQKTKRRFGAKDRQRLEALASKVEQVAEELDPFYDLFFYETHLVPPEQKPAKGQEPLAMRRKLREIGSQIRQCGQATQSFYATRRSKSNVPADLNPLFVSGMQAALLGDSRVAYDYIPAVVEYVQKATGRPRFNELTTLIGAAIRDPDFNVEQLKMICSRRQSKRDKSNAN
jgi:hypothetical protein